MKAAVTPTIPTPHASAANTRAIVVTSFAVAHVIGRVRRFLISTPRSSDSHTPSNGSGTMIFAAGIANAVSSV